MNPDLFWIPGPWRGRLAVITRPRGGDWLEGEAEGWRRANLDVVVSLLEEEEAAQLELAGEPGIARSKGIQLISFSIPDRGVPASTSAALSLLRSLSKALEQGKNVAVHCRQGIGRSGLVATALLVTSGTGVEKALEIVSAARGQAIPETAAQLEWLQHLPAERPVVASH
jgi:protein-tyrosine phosphatase